VDLWNARVEQRDASRPTATQSQGAPVRARLTDRPLPV
jgi:hypothetical protein